jgi:glycerophosphoryl diester phosphodiesterase
MTFAQSIRGSRLFPVLLLLAGAASAAAPLPRAHSHNDYEHTRPLLDALDQGFCSVEADIYLVDGKLLVAHDRDKVRAERTLESLYLDPLKARCEANNGHVYPELGQDPKLRRPLSAAAPDVEFTLLIDIKNDGAATYAVLRETLKRYATILTRFSPTNTRSGAVTIILSGDRPTEMVAAEAERYCAIDGRLSDLEPGTASVHLIPLVSESWQTVLERQKDAVAKAKAKGDFNAADFMPRREIALAHAQGRRVRFWAVPANVAMWRALQEGGVDQINADDLAGLAGFLKGQQ